MNNWSLQTCSSILTIAKRDYIASVRTKAFLFGLIAAPLVLGGSFFGLALIKATANKDLKRIAIIDRTRQVSAEILSNLRSDQPTLGLGSLEADNAGPYLFVAVTPNESNPAEQRLQVSEQIRNKLLYAAVEVPAVALTLKSRSPKNESLLWYGIDSQFDTGKQWIGDAINNAIRQVRLKADDISPDRAQALMISLPLRDARLFVREAGSGRVVESVMDGRMEAMIAPFVFVLLMSMIVMFTSGPMLPAVAEDKLQRVYELLLVSATAFELVAGKVVAANSRASNGPGPRWKPFET